MSQLALTQEGTTLEEGTQFHLILGAFITGSPLSTSARTVSPLLDLFYRKAPGSI